MSEILKALKISEQNHQRYDATPIAPMNLTQNTANVSKLSIALAFIAPVIMTTSWLGYDVYRDYQAYQAKPSIVMKVEPEFIEVESAFSSSPYFPPKELKSTYVENSRISKETLKVNNSVVAETESRSAVESDPQFSSHETVDTVLAVPASETNEALDSLSQLDLSQFSPELAQRVQSAFNHSDDAVSQLSNVEPTDAYDQNEAQESIKLSQRGADFVGLLPSMNFQTHVYSSQVDKRWVKVNGSEYVEGDQIGIDVRLIEIRQRYTTIEYRDQLIEIPALFDWKG
ncbi:general secretion pathway protein GspB [Vibrio sp. ZSDE26]|uniref:General secretion pathway protein GspB n=1 Tax=Vibrio amylolyticus TaxID=2847292 RepID=A0A9X1XK67_9VIBR|nr:general secretion pathway protein GspB [Vibrio amylolyticus]MCK6264777.1 general secretion pathway protein GspB [Vibrio amylolyticus]